MGQILTHPLTSKLYQRHGNELMRVGVAEMQGYRVNMEDQHTVKLSLSKKHPKLSFFSVFDGHAGDRASLYLSEVLHERVGALEDPTDSQQLIDCLLKVDEDFLNRKDERSHGSTAVFAVVEPLSAAAASSSSSSSSSSASSSSAAAADAKDAKSDSGKQKYRITVGNIGDSRAVLIRKSGECISLTEDHKPNSAAEAARIRDAGGFVSSNRVDGQLAMSRAIGDWSYKGDTTRAASKQKVIAVPDITTHTAADGDLLLICCDGIVEQMRNEDAAQFITKEMPAQGSDPAVLVGNLLEHALKSGSKDNMTAILIQLGVDGRAYDTAKHEYIPGPYYPDNHEFVTAFKTDARRHGLEGAALEAFVAKAMQVPKPEGARGGGGGGGGPTLASLLARAGAGAGPMGDDDEDDGASGGGGGAGAGGAGAGGVDLNSLDQRQQLRVLMELLQKGGAGNLMMDGEEEDEEEDGAPAARPQVPGAGASAAAAAGGSNKAVGGKAPSGQPSGGAGASGAAASGAGASGAPAASPSPTSAKAKKNAKKRAKKKGKAAAAAADGKKSS